MASIITRGLRVSHFRHQRTKSRRYQEHVAFSSLGYQSLEEYTRSDTCKVAMERHLIRWPKCFVCSEPSKRVAFLSWNERVLLGEVSNHITVLCDICHKKVHIGQPSCEVVVERLKELSGKPDRIKNMLIGGWARIKKLNKPKTKGKPKKAPKVKTQGATEPRQGKPRKKKKVKRAGAEQKDLRESVRLREMINLGIRPKA